MLPFSFASSLHPLQVAAFVFETLLVVGVTLLLIRHRNSLIPRFLGLTPTRLAASPLPLSDILLAFGFSFGGALLFSGVTVWHLGERFPAPPNQPSTVVQACAAVAFQLGLFAGYAHAWFWHLRKASRGLPASVAVSETTPARANTPAAPVRKREILRDAFLAYGVCVFLVSATSALWQSLLELAGVDAPPQDLVTLIADTGHPALVAALFASAVILAPITEELLFRALCFRWLRSRVTRGVALLTPALLFAFVHGNLVVFMPLAVFSLVLALAYERTGRPAVSILAHALFNLHSFTLILLNVHTRN